MYSYEQLAGFMQEKNEREIEGGGGGHALILVSIRLDGS